MSSQYVEIPAAGGGTGAVDSVNGLTGVVVLTKSNISLGNVDNTSDANKPISIATQAALDNKQNILDGTLGNSVVLGTDGSGIVIAVPGWSQSVVGGLDQVTTFEPNNVSGTAINNARTVNIEPIQNSPNETLNIDNVQINLDNANTGFDIGTNGQVVRIRTSNVTHLGSSDVGEVQFMSTGANLGNGVTPINIRGLGIAYGFGTVNANVTLSGALQGYGMQLAINSAASMDPAMYTMAFYDNNNIGCASPNYQSANMSPTIASIITNANYSGLNVNPTITSFAGNAGFIGAFIGGQLGTFNGGYYHGLNVNPTITSSRYAAGLQISMDSVTPYAGVQSTLTVQDLTLTFIAPGNNNAFSLQYTPGATAGNEVVTLLGQSIVVQIESGVSTATQVKAALDADLNVAGALTVSISGTASDPQVTFGPTNFANGVDAGQVLAAFLDGDVEITGALTFGGALSIGKLNAYASQAVVDGAGVPATIHGLISQPTVGNNETITFGDTIGVNTAMLLTVGNNSSVTSALTGLSALALPAVISMGTGSTIDQVAGATFAINLDSSSAGGTIANIDLCRSVAIPNATTTVTRLNGYKFDLPFGDPGTTTWGFYASPSVHNYFAGDLLLGGTAGSDDTVTNSSVALEVKSTTKAVVVSRMSTAERNALTAIDGMVLYNTTTDKLQVRAASTWVDLH